MHATFPIMSSCDINGPKSHEVFQYLRKNTPAFKNNVSGKIKNLPWNFCKFLIDSEGKVLIYLNPRKSLYSQLDEIESLLVLRPKTI